jgi:hypothetical protein
MRAGATKLNVVRHDAYRGGNDRRPKSGRSVKSDGGCYVSGFLAVPKKWVSATPGIPFKDVPSRRADVFPASCLVAGVKRI